MTKKRVAEDRISASFRLLPEVLRSLRHIAVVKDMTLSELVEGILLQYVNTNSMQINTAIQKRSNTAIPAHTQGSPAQTTHAPAPKPTPKGKHDWSALWSEYQALKAQNPAMTEAEFGRSKGIGKEFLNKRFKQFKHPANPTTLPPTVDTAKAD